MLTDLITGKQYEVFVPMRNKNIITVLMYAKNAKRLTKNIMKITYTYHYGEGVYEFCKLKKIKPNSEKDCFTTEYVLVHFKILNNLEVLRELGQAYSQISIAEVNAELNQEGRLQYESWSVEEITVDC